MTNFLQKIWPRQEISRNFLSSCVAIAVAGQAQALALDDCVRVTHISHGGEADHRDLGEGRVMWRDWWSQEGTATSFRIVDCGPGRMLQFRTAEENMSVTRTAFDRTDDALRVIDRHQSGARVFATFERIAADLKFIARDISIETSTEENCACASLYPGLRGEKTEFMLAG